MRGSVLTRQGAGNVFFKEEDGIRYLTVTGVQTCALPILRSHSAARPPPQSCAASRRGMCSPPPNPLPENPWRYETEHRHDHEQQCHRLDTNPACHTVIPPSPHLPCQYSNNSSQTPKQPQSKPEWDNPVHHRNPPQNSTNCGMMCS